MKRIEEKEKRKMERKHRLLAALSVNIILVLLEANMAYHLLFHCGESFDFSILRYYNHYSNFFILNSSVILVVSIINDLRGERRGPHTALGSSASWR